MNTYDIGDLVRLTGTFTDATGALADPTVVLAEVRPYVDGVYGTVVPITPVRESTGVYHADYSPATAGAYLYRIEGTGAVQQAAEGAFLVRVSNFS